MKKYILKKRIFAAVFLIAVIGFGLVNDIHSFKPLKNVILSTENVKISNIENTISESLYGRMNFVETYSFIQVLLDKREHNNFNIIKDENGFLQYSSFYREQDPNIFEYAMRVKRLKDYADTNGTKVLFVVTPSKYDSRFTKLRNGLPVNDPSSTVNELIFYLNRLGVETLNLSEYMPDNNISYQDTFFKTDHHWTVPAAFYATQLIVKSFYDKFHLDMDPDGYFTDINNYEKVTYRGGMLGSMGRRTGAVFSGVDDFTALWPLFDGNFYRESMTNDGEIVKTSGTFIDTFMNADALKDNVNLYSSSQYALYLNELRIYEKIINNDKPDGCDMFMIRDSYFSPVISFMMPMCREIDAIWSLEKSDELDIEKYIKDKKFEYIVIEVYPYNINDDAFNYFK